MKLFDHLDNNTKSKLNNLKDTKKPRQNNKKPKRPKENLTNRDVRELMGEFKDVYKRGRGGAIRMK